MQRSRWNHNIHYYRELLAAVPARCDRALDIGCGEGEFCRLLAQRAARVKGIDRSVEMVARARQTNADLLNVEFHQGDFMAVPLQETSFDFISAVAALHHMPFAAALEKSKAALRPGGVLAILGLYRLRTATDVAVTAIAVPVNRFYLLAHGRSEYAPPVVPASMPLADIRATVRELLPGVVLRRRLLWRYLLIWRRPLSVDVTRAPDVRPQSGGTGI